MKEKELIYRAKCGNKDALGEIIEKYYSDIYSFLCRRIGDKSYAEDLTQDVFLKFSVSLPQYKEQNKLKSYLFAIAVNSSNDYFRRNKEELVENNFDYISYKTQFEKELEKAQAVKNAVMSLSPKQRDVVVLRYYHDMKIKEIAEVLGIPQATVKTQLYRGEKNLKNLLKGELED